MVAPPGMLVAYGSCWRGIKVASWVTKKIVCKGWFFSYLSPHDFLLFFA